jgi:YHS domain-containing protein
MKSEFVKCKCCNEDINSEKCELAAYRTVIDGKEYLFCCKNCAKEYDQKNPE